MSCSRVLVVEPVPMGGADDHPLARVDEPLADVGALEAVRLLGVEADEAVVDLRQRRPVPLHRFATSSVIETIADRAREGADALVEEAEELAETELVLDEEHLGRHRRR